MPHLWQGVYLDSAMMCSQLRRRKRDVDAETALDLFVNRHDQSLHLDINCHASSVSITSMLGVWKRILNTQIFPLCVSLRLIGIRTDIQFCLDVLLSSNTQSSLPLKAIELIWIGRPTVLAFSQRRPAASVVLLPGGTNLPVSHLSNLRFIRSNGLRIVPHDPRALQNIEEFVLTNTTGNDCLDAVVRLPNVRKLTFRDAELRSDIPVPGDSQPLARRIESLELSLLVPQNLYPWGDEAAAIFYLDMLLRFDIPKTLKTFKLGTMSRYGWNTFSDFINDNDAASFPHVETLILDKICFSPEMAQQATSRLQKAFPNVKKLIINATKGLEGYVMKECRGFGLIFWPSVCDIQCGELNWNRDSRNWAGDELARRLIECQL
jgi:hypothetical protein